MLRFPDVVKTARLLEGEFPASRSAPIERTGRFDIGSRPSSMTPASKAKVPLPPATGPGAVPLALLSRRMFCATNWTVPFALIEAPNLGGMDGEIGQGVLADLARAIGVDGGITQQR